MPEARRLHEGPGMRRLLQTLGQGALPPAEAARFDQTTSDGLVRLILEPDGTCTVDIDHFGAEADNGIARVESAIKNLYNQAAGNAKPPRGREAGSV